MIIPLNVAATYVDRISKGDLPPKITDSYNGDFNTIKNNLNVLIDGHGQGHRTWRSEIAVRQPAGRGDQRSEHDELMKALARC